MGIKTTLNSRCSILTAASSIDGWSGNNLDVMPTILSRFHMIFIIKDEHDGKRDTLWITWSSYQVQSHIETRRKFDLNLTSLITLPKKVYFYDTLCSVKQSVFILIDNEIIFQDDYNLSEINL